MGRHHQQQDKQGLGLGHQVLTAPCSSSRRGRSRQVLLQLVQLVHRAGSGVPAVLLGRAGPRKGQQQQRQAKPRSSRMREGKRKGRRQRVRIRTMLLPLLLMVLLFKQRLQVAAIQQQQQQALT